MVLIMKARIAITIKNGVLDPQGSAIKNSLNNLGFDTVQEVRQGKIIDLVLNASSASEAKTEITQMCEKLLANTVIENYEILEIA